MIKIDILELESYLNNREDKVSNKEIEKTKRLDKLDKADKNASLDDLIEMIAILVNKSMKNLEVEFCPDEGNRIISDTRKNIEHPYILYSVISRKPKLEIKPRIREYIDGERKGEISGQVHECYIQFNIIASTNKQANEIMNRFEDLMYSYQHYFMKNGVKRILFKEHFTDKELDIYRQIVSIRSLQYYVEIEKLYYTFNEEIENILN